MRGGLNDHLCDLWQRQMIICVMRGELNDYLCDERWSKWLFVWYVIKDKWLFVWLVVNVNDYLCGMW